MSDGMLHALVDVKIYGNCLPRPRTLMDQQIECSVTKKFNGWLHGREKRKSVLQIRLHTYCQFIAESFSNIF
jgi:hypothetical protein